MSAYITSMGKFLPGEPIDNESMEEYLGKINGKPSRARRPDPQAERHRDAPLRDRQAAADPVLECRNGRERGAGAPSSGPACDLADVDFLAAATSQADHPLPGFASMVHAEMGVSALRDRDASRRVRERRDGA